MVIVKGSFRVPVVRFFDNERHAKHFAHEGLARLRRLDRFRTEEGPRRDESEGVGRLARGKIPFIKTGSTSVEATVEVVTTNPLYVLSFSDASCDLRRLAQQFGNFAVRVEDPAVLNTALPDIMVTSRLGVRRLVSVWVAQVHYDKDTFRELADLPSALPLAFSQKPDAFAHEREWRVALILSGDMSGAPDHLEVKIPITTKLNILRF